MALSPLSVQKHMRQILEATADIQWPQPALVAVRLHIFTAGQQEQ